MAHAEITTEDVLKFNANCNENARDILGRPVEFRYLDYKINAFPAFLYLSIRDFFARGRKGLTFIRLSPEGMQAGEFFMSWGDIKTVECCEDRDAFGNGDYILRIKSTYILRPGKELFARRCYRRKYFDSLAFFIPPFMINLAPPQIVVGAGIFKRLWELQNKKDIRELKFTGDGIDNLRLDFEESTGSG